MDYKIPPPVFLAFEKLDWLLGSQKLCDVLAHPESPTGKLTLVSTSRVGCFYRASSGYLVFQRREV